MKVLTLDDGRTLAFELEDFEWYGGPAPSETQEALRAEMRRQGWEAKADAVVAFVTPDALFPISPVQGRHRVVSERLIPILGKIDVFCTIELDAEAYNRAPEEFRKHMISRAAGTLATEVGKMDPTRCAHKYQVSVGGGIVEEGTFEDA